MNKFHVWAPDFLKFFCQYLILDPLSYRGTSLLTCTCKIYIGILNDQITPYLDLMGIIWTVTNSERTKVVKNIFITYTAILKTRLTRNLETFAAFIDRVKAFDRIDRNLLCINC